MGHARAHASDYKAEDGSDLTGLGYTSVDVSDPDAIANAPAPFPTLDVLILSQGTVLYGQKEFQREGWDKVMAVNVDSVLHCAQKFKPLLADAKGAVIVVNSVAGFKATLGNPAYSASKAGAVGLTKTLGQAWAPLGIRVNGFAPGLVDTKLTKVTMDHPDRREKALQKFSTRPLRHCRRHGRRRAFPRFIALSVRCWGRHCSSMAASLFDRIRRPT